MFGIWKRKEPEVLDYKVAVVSGFETSTSEFYDAIEAELSARELTGLDVSRIEYKEGGMLSAKREYLRMRRERIFFDVCSAAFGTSWFFSYRFYVVHSQIMLWEVIVMLLTLASVVLFYAVIFGLVLGCVLFGATLLSLLLLMRNTASLGFHDIDAALLQIPIFGAFYEVLVRKETYYREDTRQAYVHIVREAITSKIEEVTKAGGVELLEFIDATPPAHPGVLKMVGDILRMGR